MHLVLVEDQVESLYPFSVLHCSWELRVSRHRFIDLWFERLSPSSIEYSGRPAAVQSFLDRFPQYNLPAVQAGRCLIITASLVPTPELCQKLLAHCSTDCLFLVGSNIVARSCSTESRSLYGGLPSATTPLDQPAISTLPLVELDAPVVDQLWKCLDLVSQSVALDTEGLVQANADDLRQRGVYCIGDAPVFLGKNVQLSPLIVLDTRQGPIVLEDSVSVMAHSVIMGPCSVGAHSLIKAGAKIYQNSVIGEWCKVGGEVENSILHAFANKQHEGFLGHSFISEWVNLGADTNTSDLKNTYGPIRIQRQSKGEDSGRMFLGLLCGDHSKSGINTMFNTGTICGIHANVFGAGYTPAEIGSYAWGGIAESRVYPLKKALSVARTVMARRGKDLLPSEEALMVAEFERLNPTV